MELGLEGKTAIVTGASHGLGRAVARALSREGVRVAICGRHPDTLDAAARTIQGETGTEVLAHVADVGVSADIDALVATTVRRFGGVDILVNNADSATRKADFFELTDDDWLEILNIKLMAPIRLIRLVAPLMMAGQWGRIINVSGATARLMMPNGMPKGAAQAGLINLTKKLAVMLGRHGITVNAIEPGHMWTDGPTVASRSRMEIRREEIAKAALKEGISYEEMDSRAQAALVIGRRIEPEDSAGIVTFLASNRAATITGEVLLADGGESRYVRY